MKTQPYVLYVTDSYCGWCFGFGPLIRQFEAANRGRIEFRVISGGLFVGARARPIRDCPHIPEANARISQETGVKFGAAYNALLQEGSFILDSTGAAAGLAALRAQAPDRIIELVRSMQEAFYIQGKSLSAPSTYVEIAKDAGLDSSAVAKRLSSGEAAQQARADFETARKLGVDSYPTLLLVANETVRALPTEASVDDLNQSLETALREVG